ncbi:MAG: glutathione S-transferase [Alphaproteobacteria bacterium]|nr:glutathione S-transferase N-terminal domain-containing protein [Alphaproteobacteria bacterium]TAD88573.1 MAG: glutathione S-transferase [Alphaproteobacteria bacterium]
MKLHYSPLSPYARKVLVVAHERGLADRIELVQTAVSPTQPNEGYFVTNPLGKVPALEIGGGEALFDSRVIVAYLDSLAASGPHLIPPAPARWAAERMQALGDGICDAALLVRYETLRAEPTKSQDWIAGQRRKIFQSLDHLEAHAAQLEGPLHVGHIAVGAAIGYCYFRDVAGDVLAGRPAVTAWYQTLSARPSMVATKPA